MQFSLSEEQLALADTVAAVLRKHSPPEVVRSVAWDQEGFNQDLWRTLTELGLIGLALPSEFDGADGGLVELCVVQEQLGSRLGQVPYWSTVLAGLAITRHATPELQQEYLPRVARGEMRIAAQLGPGQSAIALSETQGQLTASGLIGTLAGGNSADAVVLIAQHRDAPALVLVELGADENRRTVTSLDPTFEFAEITLKSNVAHIISIGDEIQTVRSFAAILLAAEQLGLARAAMQMSVEYAGIRKQFGRLIGTNQAIKHRCADMYVDVEVAWSAVYHAAWSGDHDPRGADLAATVARILTAQTARSVTAGNIQVHGGIGFTWEHDAHLYVKRAMSSSLLLGDPNTELADIADRLLATTEMSETAWI